MPLFIADGRRAREVLSSRPTTGLEVRLVFMFRAPTSIDQLLDVEFEEALGDGEATPDSVRSLIARLIDERVLVSVEARAANDPETQIAVELASLGRLSNGLAGDLVAMGAWSSQLRIDGQSPAELLSSARAALQALHQGLRAARPDYIEEQVGRLPAADPDRAWRLHLGCGRTRAEGWVNIDVSSGDLRLNLCWGLPFEHGSVSHIYFAHTLEHLDYHTAAPRLLRELHRVLRPGGVVRIAVPDIGAFCREYAAGNQGFFQQYDQARPEFSVGAGYLTPLSKVMRLAGSATRPDGWFEHKMGYDFETLAQMLDIAGFTGIEASTYLGSADPILTQMDSHSAPAGFVYDEVANTLFVEARR